MRGREVYEITCHACGELLELPVTGQPRCPRCGRTLRIEWRRGEVSARKDPAAFFGDVGVGREGAEEGHGGTHQDE